MHPQKTCAFSLVELLFAISVLTLAILPMIGFVPSIIGANEVSKETLQARSLVEAVQEDLRSLTFQKTKTSLYGIDYNLEGKEAKNGFECVFDLHGRVLADVGDNIKAAQGFYFLKLEVESVEKDFNRVLIRGRLNAVWPEHGVQNNKKTFKEFSVPTVLCYEK